MKTRSSIIGATFLLAVSLGLALPSTASAQNSTWEVKLTVPVLVPQPNDLHMTFLNTGGNIANVVWLMGPVPIAITVLPGNTINFDWGAGVAPKIPAGTMLKFRFDVNPWAGVPIAFSSGTWTNDGNVIANVLAGEVNYVNSVPTLSQWGLIVLTILLLTAATLMFARARSTSLAGAGGMTISTGASFQKFSPALFGKTLAVALSIAVIGCALALRLQGELAIRDAIGSAITAGSGAYLVHLWLLLRKPRS